MDSGEKNIIINTCTGEDIYLGKSLKTFLKGKRKSVEGDRLKMSFSLQKAFK